MLQEATSSATPSFRHTCPHLATPPDPPCAPRTTRLRALRSPFAEHLFNGLQVITVAFLPLLLPRPGDVAYSPLIWS